MNRVLFSALLLGVFMVASVGECRVGGGRSFGNRGSRGFSTPSRSYSSPHRNNSTNNRNYSNQPYNNSHQPQQPSYNTNPTSPPRYSFLKSLGAGMAGGFLGSMLFRSMGVASPLGGGLIGGTGHGGFGILEFLILGALVFIIIRMFMKRSQDSQSEFSSPRNVESSGGAERLMQEARNSRWDRFKEPQINDYSSSSGPYSGGTYTGSYQDSSEQEAHPIQPDQAMDVFFQIQGAWSGRDLSSIQSLLAPDAKAFLEDELNRLKAARRINRLENIAVRNTDVIESWNEMGKDFSTVQFTANLLDFTVDETTQQVVEGSRTSPVKFEEYWTFVREPGSSQWKLSAIQQN